MEIREHFFYTKEHEWVSIEDNVATIGIKDPEGGFSNLILNGAGDGKLYSLALRPLLPDETD